jgi:hypothetical protein
MEDFLTECMFDILFLGGSNEITNFLQVSIFQHQLIGRPNHPALTRLYS